MIWNFAIYLLVFVLSIIGVVRMFKLPVRQGLAAHVGCALTFAFSAIILLGWYLLTNGERIEDRILAPLILPAPMEVLASFPSLYKNQDLFKSILTSFTRVLAGFSLAALVAVPLGVLMASYTSVSSFFKPLSLSSSYVPIPVFIPLTIAWWGAGEMQKTGFIFIACFVALLPLIIKSVSDVPQTLLDVAMTKGANQWQLVRNVLFPVSFADIWDHMRGIYAVGWGWIILAEVVNPKQGLGYLIYLSDRRGNTAGIFAVIMVIIAIAVICDKLWRFAGRLMFPYRQQEG